jgi:hypothetical protein
MIRAGEEVKDKILLVTIWKPRIHLLTMYNTRIIFNGYFN